MFLNRYKTRFSQCDPQTSIVSVTCIQDSLALCENKEIPWKGSCYSLHFDRSTFDKASDVCNSEGKKLLEVNEQVRCEQHFLKKAFLSLPKKSKTSKSKKD